ncbi:unnamed protein product [Closterium sp. NIES-54]
MAGPEERGGRGAGGSGEAQAQGQPRDSAMAPMQPSLGPPRDEPRVFGLDKFNDDNFAEWYFRMENAFDHYDLLEVMEGTEKRTENNPKKSPWVRKSAQGYLLLGQALGSSQIRHIKPFQRQQASAEDMAVEGAEYKVEADLAATTLIEATGVADMAATTRATDAVAADSTESATIVTRADICGAIASKSLMDGLLLKAKRVEEQGEGEEEAVKAVAIAEVVLQEPSVVGKATLHSLDYWVIDSVATYSMTTRADLLTKLEPSPVKHVTSALEQRAEVKGTGKAMFKGADGKMVGLKNVLWVPNLAANLISVRRLQKASMDTSSKGAKTYTAKLGERILWDLHEDRDVYNEMWQIPVVPMPKERQVVASISTKGEAVGSGDGANGRAKEIELSKKSDMAETVKTDWLPMVERQQDRLVKAICTDRGGEFLRKKFSLWLKKNGIRHSLTMPYSPAMNGMAERANRAITETARGLLIEAGLPDYSWPDTAENEAKIGVRFGDVKSSGLEHVELPLEEAKDAEEEEEDVQQVSEHAPPLPSCTTSAPRIRVTPQQRQGLHVPAAEEEGRGKRRIQAPNRLTYDALGRPAKSPLAEAALIVGDDEESDYEECAFAFFSPVEMPGEPATLKEASESSDAEDWKKAMEIELKSIEENGTWELRYKYRLVAKGYQQKEKVDYNELFALVVKPTTLRTLLAGAAIKGWVVKQMNVTTAFLNGILEEEIFMAQPERFDDCSGRVWKLKKALYGLKQAPRQWYLKLREVLDEIGFTPSFADHSLFMLGEGEQRIFMVVYVDAILIFSPSSDLVKEVMLKLQDKFKCKALGDVSFYLGLHIKRDVEKRCMWVHQRKYLDALAANCGQIEGHVATPFPSGFKCVKGPEERSVGEEERRRFHSLVGSLMYAAVNTRPDVAFATGQLARVAQRPHEEQVAARMRVAKYLGKTLTVGLQYSAAAQRRQKGADGVESGHLFLTAFSDASYASEPKDMTSVGGSFAVLSEYMALFRAVREIVWQRRLLAELGEEQQGPTPLYCDSQGAIALAKNPVLHGLTKHMRVKWHWTRSMVAAGEVELRYVKTRGQPADMMTKRLVEQQHWKCWKLAGMSLN